MREWAEDLSTSLLKAQTLESAFTLVATAATKLGFEYCAYGLRLTLPVVKPRILLFSNYPSGWKQQYEAADYVAIDPTVLHGRRTQTPVVWSDSLFRDTPEIWDGACSFGLRAGWAQSNFDAHGVVGMLTLARSGAPVSASELRANDMKMRYLVLMSHPVLAQALLPTPGKSLQINLTAREVEILKWLADGKTSRDVSDILRISFDTVNFHVKNAIAKLGVTNKTAAAAQAILMGLLD
ncbi:Regulatory protein SdiA [compost metagenome]|uniref:autoinducer binding domain-containing protein n=1 Tax=Achromobacter sp. Root83 TaxID=1736602 RepID=UPI00070A91F3|nr:autoinducer binding domain-containing protein [Achromobacter sp. Root83]KRC69210.1 LuxR family transcriptional regulator [Achromobacter sp. Root83]